MKKVLFFLGGIVLGSTIVVSCSSSDDNSQGKYNQEVIQAEFKINVPPAVESSITAIRIMSATPSKAIFYTQYEDISLDIRAVSSDGKLDMLFEAGYLKDFKFTDLKLEDKITIDNKGNLYTIVANKNLPDVKTVWKFDITTKVILPYAKVHNGDLKFISFWAAQNKLVIQDDSKIYTLGLNEQNDELTFLIGGPNSSSSQPKDGVGTNASVALNFPVSYFDNAFYILEKNRFLRKVSLNANEASVKTISIFETGAYAYLTMGSENTFFIDRKTPEVGLSEGAFDTQEIKSYFYNASVFYGYPIVFKGQMDRELLVSTAMYTILDGAKNGVPLYTMNSYLPANNVMWSASKKSIVYIKDFSNQINQTKQTKL